MLIKNGEINFLDQSKESLVNAQNKVEIATIMAEFGYGVEKIAEGEAIQSQAVQIWKANKIEDDETSEASTNFKELYKKLGDIYRLDRKKAKVVFRKDSEILKRLLLTGRESISFFV